MSLTHETPTNNADSIEVSRESSESAFQGLYTELGASTPLELSNKFTELDQKEMKSGNYDYNDEESELNITKNRLEQIDPSTLTDEENKWRDEMLWLWNHHATSMALYGNRDIEAARYFVDEALSHMPPDHPNKITGLLYFLSRGELEAAELWAQTEVYEMEKAAAQDAIQMYKEHVLNT